MRQGVETNLEDCGCVNWAFISIQLLIYPYALREKYRSPVDGTRSLYSNGGKKYYRFTPGSRSYGVKSVAQRALYPPHLLRHAINPRELPTHSNFRPILSCQFEPLWSRFISSTLALQLPLLMKRHARDLGFMVS